MGGWLIFGDFLHELSFRVENFGNGLFCNIIGLRLELVPKFTERFFFELPKLAQMVLQLCDGLRLTGLLALLLFGDLRLLLKRRR